MAKMSKEAKEARNRYQREWRKANPDKVKKYNSTYWENKIRKNKTTIDKGEKKGG